MQTDSGSNFRKLVKMRLMVSFMLSPLLQKLQLL